MTIYVAWPTNLVAEILDGELLVTRMIEAGGLVPEDRLELIEGEILAVTRHDGARAIGVSLLHEKRGETAGFHYVYRDAETGLQWGGHPRGSTLVRACHAIKDCLATARARSDRRHTQTAPTLKRARQDHRSLNYARPPRDESIRADDPRFACGSDL
jgi:hypothetical protein